MKQKKTLEAETGLCSLVVSRLGAETVIATDLKKSIPLLYRNCLNNNFGGRSFNLKRLDEGLYMTESVLLTANLWHHYSRENRRVSLPLCGRTCFTAFYNLE